MKHGITLGLCFLSACALSHERAAPSDASIAMDSATGTDAAFAADAASPDAGSPLDAGCDPNGESWTTTPVWSAFRESPGLFAVDADGAYVFGRVDFPMESTLGESFVETWRHDAPESRVRRFAEIGTFPMAIGTPLQADSPFVFALASSGALESDPERFTTGWTYVDVEGEPGVRENPIVERNRYDAPLAFAGTVIREGAVYVIAPSTAVSDTTYTGRGTADGGYLDLAVAPELTIRRVSLYGEPSEDLRLPRAELADGRALTLIRGSTRIVVSEAGPLLLAVAGVSTGSDDDPMPTSLFVVIAAPADTHFTRLTEPVPTSTLAGQALDVPGGSVRFGPSSWVGVPFSWTHGAIVELKVVGMTEDHTVLAETRVEDAGFVHRFGAAIALAEDDVVVVRDLPTDGPVAPANQGFAAFEATRHTLVEGLPRSERSPNRIHLDFVRAPRLHPRSPANAAPSAVYPLALDTAAVRGLLYVHVHERADYDVEGYGPWASGVATLVRGPLECP